MPEVLPSNNLQLFPLALKDKIVSRISNECECSIVLIDVIEFSHLDMLVGTERAVEGLRAVSAIFNDIGYDLNGRAYWLNGDQFALVLPGEINHQSLCHLIQNAEQILRRQVGDRRGLISLRAGGCYKAAGVDARHAYETANYHHQTAKVSGLAVSIAQAVDMSNSIVEKIRLQRAMQNGEFSLYIQPKRSLLTGELCGGEALFRWIDSNGDFIPPDIVIPLMHKIGMTDVLTNWVLSEVLQILEKIIANGFDGRLAFNVSVDELLSDSLLHRIKYLHKANPGLLNHLEIEVTEQANLYCENVSERLKQLKRYGVSLTLDDFGTGYSNYQVLAGMDFDNLKLDRIFVSALNHAPESQLITQHIVDLTRIMSKHLVVEGIENQLQCSILSSMGVCQGQGYLFGHPAPAEEFINLMSDTNPPLEKNA